MQVDMSRLHDKVDPTTLSKHAVKFRNKVFLQALRGIMSRPEPCKDASGSIMFHSDKVEAAWKVADLSLKNSGLI